MVISLSSCALQLAIATLQLGCERNVAYVPAAVSASETISVSELSKRGASVETQHNCALSLIQKSAHLRRKVRRQSTDKPFDATRVWDPNLTSSSQHAPCVANSSPSSGISLLFPSGQLSRPSGAKGFESRDVRGFHAKSNQLAGRLRFQQAKSAAAGDNDDLADEWIYDLLTRQDTTSSMPTPLAPWVAASDWALGTLEQSLPLMNFTLIPHTALKTTPIMLEVHTTTTTSSTSKIMVTSTDASGKHTDSKAGVTKPSAFHFAEIPCGSPRSPILQAELQVLTAAGHFPRRASCGPREIAEALLGNVSTVSLVYEWASLHHDDHTKHRSFFRVFYIVLAWAAFCAFWLLRLLGGFIKQSCFQISGAGRTSAGEICAKSGESTAWKEGLFAWASMSWSTMWVAGLPNHTQSEIRREEIGPSAFPEDAAESCYDAFREMWEQEVEERGLPEASLKRVLFNYIGWRRVLFVYTYTLILGSIKRGVALVMVDIFLGHLTWVSDMQYTSHTEIDLALPSTVAILAYGVLPVAIAILDTIKSLIDGRTDMKIEAALAMMIYSKTQRLPVSSTENKSSGGLPDIVQLVTVDIKRNMMSFTSAICFMMSTPVFLIFLFAYLCKVLAWAAPLGMLGMLPFCFLMVYFDGLIKRSVISFQASVDQRAKLLQEVFASMRIVKSYAWEDSYEERLLKVRKLELSHLRWLLIAIGGMVTTCEVAPRILSVSCLGAFLWLSGSVDAHRIFICLQILALFMANISKVADATRQSVSSLASLQRVERYLKQEELLEHRCCGLPLKNTTAKCEPAERPPAVRVRGTFRLQADSAPVLHNLKLDIRQGSFVAIVGEVGSGKSMLLHAMLGELQPVDSASVDTSSREVAYCAQVPWIIQGSLRENVVLGHQDAVDEERYWAVLSAAALQQDLEILPGGDAVPIGDRGVTLSGGQKMRTALARAAYSKADLVLMDNPFAPVDTCTGQVLLKQLCKGPSMQNRTRIAVVQPDPNQLMEFDEVIVLVRGRVALQGAPAQVVHSEAFKSLLSSSQKTSTESEPKISPKERMPVSVKKQQQHGKLIDEEHRGRVDWQTIRFWAGFGKTSWLVLSLLMLLVSNGCGLLGAIQMATWANKSALGEPQAASDFVYIISCLVWNLSNLASLALAFLIGIAYSVDLSHAIHGQVLKSTMQVPLQFFERTPLGHIIIRFVADLGNLDFQLVWKILAVAGKLLRMIVVLCYIQRNMPLMFLWLALPFYVLVLWMAKRYYLGAFQLMYLDRSLTSDVSSHVVEVTHSSTFLRAMGYSELFRSKFAQTLDRQLRAQFLSNTVMRNWFQLRAGSIFSFLQTLVALIGLAHASYFGPGTVATSLVLMTVIIETLPEWLQDTTEAQFEMISMQRLQEYVQLPKEKPAVMPGDQQISSRWVTVPREALRHVKVLLPRGGNPLQAVSEDGNVLFQASADGCSLEPSPVGLGNMAGGGDNGILTVSSAHRISSVNYKSGDAAAMMAELCGGGPHASTLVRLYLEGSWLRKGARVQIENVVVGYDKSVEVLRGVSLDIQAKQRVGLVGATGAGKSSLLLAILRLLEPRSGRILIDGKDTAALGLRTLRQAIGFVPQDPVLFSGSLRQNLDPFGWYTDEQVWLAFKCVQIVDFIENLPNKLDQQIEGGGENLSFGQRQLLCLARMVLRQPKLLLFDEATSALDPRAQETLITTLHSVFLDCTVISVAHRLETVLDCDVIAVMEHGRIIEKGNPTDLRSMTEGVFSKMLMAGHTGVA